MNCGCVLPNLFVGPDPWSVEDFEHLRALGVSAVLSLQQTDERDRGSNQEPKNDLKSNVRSEMEFHSIPITDFNRAELQARLPDAVNALAKLLDAGHTVYLHCTAGVNRSPTVAAAYLHWKKRWPLQRALQHLQNARNCCPDAAAIRMAQKRTKTSRE